MVETRWLTIDDIARYWKLRWSLQEAQRSAVLETSHRCVCGISETFIHHSNKCRARQCEKQRHNAWVHTPNLKQCAMDGANQQMCWKTHPNTHTHTCFDVQNLSQLIFQHSIHQAQPYSKSLVRVSTLRMNIQYHSMLMANDNSSLSFSRSYVQFLRMLRLCKKDHRKEHRKRGLKGAKTKQVLGKTHTANYCTQVCNASSSATAASTCKNSTMLSVGRFTQNFGRCKQHSTTMQVPKPAPCTCDAEVQVAHSHHSTWKTTSQWPFQEPKLEVPTIYKAYIRPM